MLIGKGSQLAQPQGDRCRRCAKLIRQDGHAGYCSSDCREAERVDVSREKLRALAFERDGGRCHACGLDCLALRAELDALFDETRTRAGGWGRWHARKLALFKAGFDRHALETGAPLFEVDHDPPLVLGGSNTLEGVKTKCLGCHKSATKALAKSRATSRRPFRGSR